MKSHPLYPQYDITEDGKVFSRSRNKFLKQSLDKTGYYRVSVYIKGKGVKTAYVHKLVAETYIDNPLGYKFCAHIDENKTNNKVDNLVWRKTSKRPTDKDEKEKEIKIKESKALLESNGYTVLTKQQIMNIMKRIRQS